MLVARRFCEESFVVAVAEADNRKLGREPPSE